MLIHDVKKIEEFKKKVSAHPKYLKKIEKIERKYFSIRDVHDEIKAIYVDKYDSKVVVYSDGKVLQISGPKINPKFTSFIISYFIVLIIGIPVMFLGFVNPALSTISESISLILNPAALLLNILTVINCKETLMKNKLLLILMIFAMILNITAIIF